METFWNGQACGAAQCVVRVGTPPTSTWWCAEFEGQERKAVRVIYGTQIFFLDDEDGSGWFKVTHGRGSPAVSSRSLPADSTIVRFE